MKRYSKPQTSQADLDKFNANKFVLENYLFDKQLSFVQDSADFKIAVCSRRSGKTVACAAHLVYTAMNSPDTVNLYITLSSVSGKRIIWREFKKLIKDFKVKAKVNDIELSISFENGATIYIAGAKDASEIEKFRGLAIKLCYIDECQSFRSHIKDLVDDVIAPALMDYAGSLCLIGTPSPIPVGYFWDCWNSKNEDQLWAKHHWTFWDNRFIAEKSKRTHAELFDRELKRTGKTADDPSIQREWYGRWVLDVNSLLVRYDETKNHYKVRPESRTWQYVLGVDIGFNDADALAVLGWCEESPATYLVEEIVAAKQGITELVENINKMQSKYNIAKIVMDTGGLGKKIQEELIRRYLIPVEAADKTRKMENIELLNDALRTGRFKAKNDSKFTQDSYLVEIDRDKSTPDRIKVSDRYHSDIIDAVLYAFKLSPAYAYEEPPKLLYPGTKEWAEAQTGKMFEAELENMLKEQEYQRWIRGEDY